MRISDWSSDVCSSDLLEHGDRFLADRAVLIDADPQCHRRAVALADADIDGEFGRGVARRLPRRVPRDVEPRRTEPYRRTGLQHRRSAPPAIAWLPPDRRRVWKGAFRSG